MTTSIPAGRGYILDANQGLTPSQPALKASAGSTSGQLTVLSFSLDGGPPRHTHSREDESIYLLAGQLAVECDGQEFAALHAATTGPESQVMTVMAEYGIRPA